MRSEDSRHHGGGAHLDDIDTRAAQLLARMADRKPSVPPEGADSGAAETVPEPAVPPADAEFEETADAGAEPPDEVHQHQPVHRMAAPPWQSTAPTPGGWTADETPAPSEPDAARPQDATQPAGAAPRTLPDLPPPPPGWPGGPPPWPIPPTPRWFSPPPPPQDRRQRRQQTMPPEAGVMRSPWTPPSLDDIETTHPSRLAPPSGWRRALHEATGGRVNPGVSARDREQQEVVAQIRQPTTGDFRIAVLSIKGGVGKTTTTIGLGSAFAMVRNDRVIAVDANPDRGTLAERVADTSTSATVWDLLRDPDIKRYADVRRYTRMAPSRLEVLASEQDPAVSEVFGETDYRRTVEILQDYYNIILTDCGTGIMHSAMAGVLDMAHAIVLVSSPAIDAARSASATLDWLARHGYSTLASDAHVVLSGSRRGAAAQHFDKVYDHFAARCSSIHLIPFEPHLATGADIDFSQLKPTTVRAYLELAGAVSSKFVH
ncbi:hypothetical protein BH11ACT6_BH11ACT6_54500 [soil metagenome]